MLEIGRFAGRVYAIPFAVSDVLLYVNEDLLAELGLSHADIPVTWEDLLELTTRLDSAKVPTQRLPLWLLGMPTTAETGVAYEYLITLWQQGGDLFESGTHRVAFADPPGVRALQLWQRLVDSGALDLQVPDNAWASGHLLFNVASSANLLASYANLPFQVGVAPLPSGPFRATGIGGRTLAVLANDPHTVQAAAEFVAWMTSPAVNRRWSLETGYSPLDWESFASADFQSALRTDPRRNVGLSELLYARHRPNVLSYADVSAILGDAIEKALYKHVDAASALADAAARAQMVADRLEDR